MTVVLGDWWVHTGDYIQVLHVHDARQAEQNVSNFKQEYDSAAALLEAVPDEKSEQLPEQFTFSHILPLRK